MPLSNASGLSTVAPATQSGNNTFTGQVNVTDSLFSIKDDADPTKVVQFQASGLTTGTTSVLTVQPGSYQIAGTNVSGQTFTGSTTFSSGTLVFGSSATASTTGLATGATTTGLTKTISVGTGGLSGSTTTVSVGPTAGAGAGTLTLNGGLTLATFNQPMRSVPVTVASLLAAATAGAGARAAVSDATLTYTSANIGTAVTGGGANTVPVWCTGAAWVIG